jgi:predicted nucleotidyltransferase
VKFDDLPERVTVSLRALAQDAEAAGGKIFIFGSFARGDARPTSDLDIGFYARKGGDRFKQLLSERIPELPTIRPIELVDFEQLEPDFRLIAEKNILPLS